jgi:hypothetical protein
VRIMVTTADDADYANSLVDVDNIGLIGKTGDIFRGARGLVDALGLQGRNFVSTISSSADASDKVISKYARNTDRAGNRVFADQYGTPLITDESGEAALLGDVIEFLDTRYTRSQIDANGRTGLYDALSNLNGLVKRINEEKIGHNIDTKAASLVEGQSYFPRYAKADNVQSWKDKGIKSDREYLYMNRDYDRQYETFAKGSRGLDTASGQLYEDPVNSIVHFARDTATDIKNYEVGIALKRFADSGMEELSGQTRRQILKTVDDVVAADASFKTPSSVDGVTVESIQINRWDDLSGAQKEKFIKKYPNLEPLTTIGDVGAGFDEKTAKLLDEYFSDPKSRSINLDYLKKINQEIVPLRSTLDISGGFVTNAAVFFTDPVGFLANMGRALGDTFSTKRVNDVFESPEWLGGAKDGTDYIGAGKYVTGINPADPTALREYIYGGSKASQNKAQRAMGKFTAPFNRNFAMIGNRNRMALFYDAKEIYERALRDAAESRNTKIAEGATLLDDAALREIGRAVDRITGIATKQGGDYERALLFAPNFYRSMFETVGNLYENKSIEGDLAKKYVSNMVAAGVTLITGVALAQGRDPAEVLAVFDGRALEEGELRLNPNFGTMRVLGRDINIWGPYDSMARLAIGAGNMGLQIPEEGTSAVRDYLFYAARTKGSPVVSTLLNAYLKDTFTGRDFLSVEGLASQITPFSVSTGIEEGMDAFEVSGNALDGLISGMIGSGLSASGMKENPVTPYEAIDMAARAKKEFGNRPYAELTPQEKDIINKENPLAKKRLDVSVERRSGPEGQMAAWRSADREKLITQQQLAMEELQTSGDRYQFRKTMDALAERHALAARLKEEDLEIEYDTKESGTPESVISAYYTLLDTARDPLSGQLDWDLLDAEVANLQIDIKGGVFGDPRRAQEFLDERLVFKGNPNVKWYFDNKNVIREVLMDGFNYWDQKDRAFNELQASVSKLAGRNINTYNGLVEEISASVRENNIRKVTVLKNMLNRIDRKSDLYRKRMRKKNPELEKALIENGYL